MATIEALYGVWRFTGIIAAVLAWFIILLSISQNPWFNVYRHALSDLGDPRANKPWIYNIGLMVVGLITCIYSLYLTYITNSKTHIYASALLFIAGIFLVLVGVYPSGTRPHTFISTWFFIQMWLALLATTIGMIIDGRTIHAIVLGTMTIVGPLGAIFIKWPSVALQEIFGIVLIDIYIVILTMVFK